MPLFYNTFKNLEELFIKKCLFIYLLLKYYIRLLDISITKIYNNKQTTYLQININLTNLSLFHH